MAIPALAAAAHIENELRGWKIFAVHQHKIEVVRVELLGGRNPIERALAVYGHLFQNGSDRTDRLIVRRQQ
jgi:hypothetical protein